MKKRSPDAHARHGGFFGSLWLLVRSLLNICAFSLFWYGLLLYCRGQGTAQLTAGAAAVCALLFVNLIFPAVRLINHK